MGEVEALISEWMTLDAIIPYLEPGDLLEFRRIIIRPAFTHWAVYIGKTDDVHEVIHPTTKDGDIGGGLLTAVVAKITNDVEVRCDSLDVACGGDLLRINNSLDSKRTPCSPLDIIERAKSRLDVRDYNLVFSNCEHFAKWARYCEESSSQVTATVTYSVSSLLETVVGAVNPAVGAGVGLAFRFAAQHMSGYSTPET